MPHYKQSVSQNNRPSSKSSCRGLNGTLTRFHTLSDLVLLPEQTDSPFNPFRQLLRFWTSVWFTGQWAIFSHWWVKSRHNVVNWVNYKANKPQVLGHIWKGDMCDSSFICAGMSWKLRARLTSRISSTKASENPVCPQRIPCVHERTKHDISQKPCFLCLFFLKNNIFFNVHSSVFSDWIKGIFGSMPAFMHCIWQAEAQHWSEDYKIFTNSFHLRHWLEQIERLPHYSPSHKWWLQSP